MPKMFVEEKYLRAKNIPTIEFLSSLRYALSYEINVINSSCQLKSFALIRSAPTERCWQFSFSIFLFFYIIIIISRDFLDE